MVSKIIRDYQGKISREALVLRYRKKWLALYLSVSLVVCMPSVLLATKRHHEVGAFSCLIAIVGSLCVLMIKSTKRFVTRKYRIKETGWHWCGVEFRKLQAVLTKDYLISLGIIVPEDVKRLTEIIRQRANDVKPPLLLGSNFIFSILAAIFTCLFAWLFTHSTNWQEVFNTAITLVIIMLQCLGVTMIISGFWEDLWFRKSHDLKEFAAILEDVYFLLKVKPKTKSRTSS